MIYKSTIQSHTVIPTAILEDPNIPSWEACGFLIFLLSSCSDNHAITPKERDVLIPQLIKAGYVIKTDCGCFDVFDTRQV